MDRPTILQSLKRFVPFRYRLFQARERWRRSAALKRVRRDAQAVISRAKQWRAADPTRPVCGILLVEHMGDIIACEPVVRWARERYPAARVVWITKPLYAELLRAHPQLDAVWTVRSLASVPMIVQSGAFEPAIDLHVSQRPTGIDGVRYVKSWGNPAIDTTTYLCERSLIAAFSKAAGIEELSGEAVMHVPSETKASVDRLNLPPRFVAIHAASNDAARDWSPDAWSELVGYIVDAGLSVVEVGLETRLPARPLVSSFCGQLSLLQTSELIRRSSFFVGVDSGPAHMANAWHTPSLILLSRFHGHDWRPYEGFFAEHSDRLLLRHPGPLSTLAAGQVIDHLRADPDWLRLVGVSDQPLAR